MQADAAGVIAWARESRLQRVWIAYAPLGPTREPLAALQTSLEETGIEVRRVAREWDRAFHPHATAGFFRCKKKALPGLKEILRDEQLA